jgi:hypothetical protein
MQLLCALLELADEKFVNHSCLHHCLHSKLNLSLK